MDKIDHTIGVCATVIGVILIILCLIVGFQLTEVNKHMTNIENSTSKIEQRTRVFNLLPLIKPND